MRPMSHCGFTLIEALVAMGIVAAGILSLVALAQQVTDTVARSRRHLAATWLADEGVAARTRQPMAATASDCLERDVAGCNETLDGRGLPAATAPAFVRRWRVARVGAAYSPAWTVAVCVVPAADRAAVAVAPGTCVTRVVHEVWP